MKRKTKEPDHIHTQVPCDRAMTALVQYLKDAITFAEAGKIQEALQLAVKFGLEVGRYRSMNRELVRRTKAGEFFKINVQSKGVQARRDKAAARLAPLMTAVDDMLENDAQASTPAALARRLSKLMVTIKTPSTGERYSLEYLEKLIRRRLSERDSTDQ